MNVRRDKTDNKNLHFKQMLDDGASRRDDAAAGARR